MHRLLFGTIFVFGSVVACSVSSTDGKGQQPSSSSSSTSSSGGSTSSSGGSSSGSSSGGNTNNRPPASPLEAPIDIDGACPAFTACGGNPIGAYDYQSGCLDDVFADLRNACPSVDTSKLKVTVKGTIYLDGSSLGRDITGRTSGEITLPASCAQGQCAAVEANLKGAFDSVSCTGSSSCTCTVSKTETNKDGTTYTIDGNTLTTADGDTYSICANGADLKYTGKSAGSEEGAFTLKKR